MLNELMWNKFMAEGRVEDYLVYRELDVNATSNPAIVTAAATTAAAGQGLR